MPHARSRMMLVLTAALAALAGGCGRPQPVQDLPPHRMDLTAPHAPHTALPATQSDRARPDPSSPADPYAPRSGYRPWKYIVIHHSATPAGCAADFDRYHRGKGWDELGYHFVINNGTGAADGLIETGYRWQCQKWGAHAGGSPDNDYNNRGIGICLVGDLTGAAPTAAQLASLNRLVLHLARTYRVAPADIVGHRDVPGAKTACPGDAFHKHLHAALKPQWARELETHRF